MQPTCKNPAQVARKTRNVVTMHDACKGCPSLDGWDNAGGWGFFCNNKIPVKFGDTLIPNDGRPPLPLTEVTEG